MNFLASIRALTFSHAIKRLFVPLSTISDTVVANGTAIFGIARSKIGYLRIAYRDRKVLIDHLLSSNLARRLQSGSTG